MKGEVYTIFTGDTIEKVDLVVLGILHNALGPKQDVILVQLLGDKVETTGVVAGMSGSPVYFDGKLAGALLLKLGVFTKEAIGGVTPIEDMLDVQSSSALLPALRPLPHQQRQQHLSVRSSAARKFARQTSVGSGSSWCPSRRRSFPGPLP